MPIPSHLQSKIVALNVGFENIAAAQTLAHVGRGMVAPATFTQGATQRGGGLLALPAEDFKEVLLSARFTFAYTGGTSNPQIFLGVQRKINEELSDTNALAWEDIGSIRTASPGANIEKILRLGGGIDTKDGNPVNTGQVYTVARDDTGLADYGRPITVVGPKLRFRVIFTAAGDRTGGVCTIDLCATGVGGIAVPTYR